MVPVPSGHKCFVLILHFILVWELKEVSSASLMDELMRSICVVVRKLNFTKVPRNTMAGSEFSSECY